MAAEIINGKELAQSLRIEIKDDVKKIKEKGITPHLTVILVGEDPASQSYVKGKETASNEVGLSSEIIRLPQSVSQSDLLTEIERLNNDEKVHGILVQLPLPNHIDEGVVIESIDPRVR